MPARNHQVECLNAEKVAMAKMKKRLLVAADVKRLTCEKSALNAETQIAFLRFHQDIRALLSLERLIKLIELKQEYRAPVAMAGAGADGTPQATDQVNR
jgi:hypothetical protein